MEENNRESHICNSGHNPFTVLLWGFLLRLLAIRTGETFFVERFFYALAFSSTPPNSYCCEHSTAALPALFAPICVSLGLKLDVGV